MYNGLKLNHPFVPRSARDRLRPDVTAAVVLGSVHIREEERMSFVSTQPEALTAAAGTLQGIGSSMSAQNAAAAAPKTGMVPAAADDVSALTAAQFAALPMFDMGAPVEHIHYVPARPDVSGHARPSGCDSRGVYEHVGD
jgi:hypothetical protein